MRANAIGSDRVAEDKAFIHRRRVSKVGQVTSPGQRPRKKGVWMVLALTMVVTVLVCAVGPSVVFRLPDQVGIVVLATVLLPAAIICEKLGFGQFNILSGSSIPDWLFFGVSIALVYLYSAVLVTAGWGLVRLVKWGRRQGER